MVKSKATKNDIEKLQQMYDTSSYINKNFDVLSKKSTFEKSKISITKPSTLIEYQNFAYPNTVTVKFEFFGS